MNNPHWLLRKVNKLRIPFKSNHFLNLIFVTDSTVISIRLSNVKQVKIIIMPTFSHFYKISKGNFIFPCQAWAPSDY